MGKSRPTEADLGLELTPEETEIASRPVVDLPDDDIRVDDDLVVEPEVEAVPAAPDLAAATDKAVDRDPTTGKFAPKPKPPAGTVDVRALQEARAENRQLMERMTALLEVQARRDAPKPAAPAPEVVLDKMGDPIGFMDNIDKRLGSIENEGKQAREQTAAQQREEQEIAAAVAVAAPVYQAAVAADPTFQPMHQALLDTLGRELQFMHQRNPEYVRDPRAFLVREMKKLESAHIRFAAANQIPIDQYLRGFAEAKGVRVDPAAAQPASQPAPRSIADRQQAQERHMSLGSGPGNAPSSTALPDARTVAKMSTKEFNALMKRVGDEGMDAIAGR